MNKLPPLAPGTLPLIGHALQLRRDSHRFILENYRQLGGCFRVKVLHHQVLFLLGADMQTQFFACTNKSLRMDLAYAYLKPLFGNIAFTADPETYAAERGVLRAPFRASKMPRYLAAMTAETRAWLDSLPDEGHFDLVSSMNRLVLDISVRALMGPDFREEVGKPFVRLYDIISGGYSPFTMGTPPWLSIRRRFARARLGFLLEPTIRKRRAGIGNYDDLLKDLTEIAERDGVPIDDEKLANYIIMLIFAAQAGTAASASWAIVELLLNTGQRGPILAEIDEAFESEQDSYPEPRECMPTLHLFALENERMHAVASMLMRRTAEPIEIAGYHVPSGWLVVLNAYLANHLEENFPAPDQFDPCRFTGDRARVERPMQRMATFGGGQRSCPGMSFAHNTVMTIVAMLFREFDLEPLTEVPGG